VFLIACWALSNRLPPATLASLLVSSSPALRSESLVVFRVLSLTFYCLLCSLVKSSVAPWAFFRIFGTFAQIFAKIFSIFTLLIKDTLGVLSHVAGLVDHIPLCVFFEKLCSAAASFSSGIYITELIHSLRKEEVTASSGTSGLILLPWLN